MLEVVRKAETLAASMSCLVKLAANVFLSGFPLVLPVIAFDKHKFLNLISFNYKPFF